MRSFFDGLLMGTIPQHLPCFCILSSPCLCVFRRSGYVRFRLLVCLEGDCFFQPQAQLRAFATHICVATEERSSKDRSINGKPCQMFECVYVSCYGIVAFTPSSAHIERKTKTTISPSIRRQLTTHPFSLALDLQC